MPKSYTSSFDTEDYRPEISCTGRKKYIELEQNKQDVAKHS